MKHLFYLLLASASLAYAQPAYYWNFNEATLNPPSIGPSDAEMHATYFVIGEDGENSDIGFGPGTTVNAYASTPAGSGLEFHDVVGVYSMARVTVTGLDLTDQVGTTFSFAMQIQDVFAAWESMAVEYRTTGAWQTAQNFGSLPRNSWNLYQVALPSLDGQSHADVRISILGVFEAGKRASLDNIQIVPEPGTVALVTIFAGLSACQILRARRCVDDKSFHYGFIRRSFRLPATSCIARIYT